MKEIDWEQSIKECNTIEELLKVRASFRSQVGEAVERIKQIELDMDKLSNEHRYLKSQLPFGFDISYEYFDRYINEKIGEKYLEEKL